jgi:hypothetical protein
MKITQNALINESDELIMWNVSYMSKKEETHKKCVGVFIYSILYSICTVALSI